ncbi:MAG: hypothetical protein V4548_11255 [Bacteroidota bacterium]
MKKNNMKKALFLVLIATFLTSCGGPKRMSCYGKRCVEVNKKQQTPRNQNTTKIS